MGFNRRRFSEKIIKVLAESEFKSFQRFMISSDSQVFEDEWSYDFFCNFFNSEELDQEKMYNSLKIKQ